MGPTELPVSLPSGIDVVRRVEPDAQVRGFRERDAPNRERGKRNPAGGESAPQDEVELSEEFRAAPLDPTVPAKPARSTDSTESARRLDIEA